MYSVYADRWHIEVHCGNVRHRVHFVEIGQTVAEVWRFFLFCSKWRSSAILDLLYAFWTRVLRGFYRCAKSGWNRCSTVDYCNIFASSVWKRLFAPQMFGRILSLNGEQGQRNPQKTSARKHGTWHIRVRRSSKSVHRFGLGANRGIKFKRKVD